MTKLRGGAKALVPLDDLVGRAAYFVGDLDPKLSWVVSRILKLGDLAVDAGANFGLVTLSMARQVGPTGRVEAFEPVPTFADALRQSLAENAFSQVTLNEMALGEAPGTAEIAIPAGNTGGASLVPDRYDGGAVTARHTVTVTTLDAALDGRGEVALLKIDTEGFEAAVLRGAERLLSQKAIRAVILEDWDTAETGTLAEPGALLASHGYRIFSIPKRLMVRMRLLPVDEAIATHKVGHDLVALRGKDAALFRRLGLDPAQKP